MASRMLFLFALALMCPRPDAVARDVFVFTEDYPPYNFRLENGQIGGYATELVRLILDESGLEYDVAIAPWARAMRFTETADNTLLFSIARTDRRENRFQWLVPLADDRYHLFARASDTRTVTLDGLRQGMFKVVCITADISCLILAETGVPDSAVMHQADLDRAASLKLVQAGRVDFYTGGIRDYHLNIRQLGFAPDAFKPVFDLGVGKTLYLAGGTALKPEIRQAIMDAYARLSKSGAFQQKQADTFGRWYKQP